MADLLKASTAGVDSLGATHGVILSTLFAGEALAKADACYIYSDGTVKKSVSTVAVSGIANFIGFTNKAYAAGQAVELFGAGSCLGYAVSTVTPGAFYWVSTNAGLLATTQQVTGDRPVAYGISTSDIVVIR